MSISNESPGANQASQPLEIACEPLPSFDPADLASVQRAFRSATPCVLRQAWLDRADVAFCPAVVRAGWRERSLLVLAELTDRDIFNSASELNQRTWELGDVLEIFLQPADSASYVEFHITPENQRLQLRFADRRAVEEARKTGTLDGCWIWGEAIHSKTWIGDGTWHVYAEVPALTVCGVDAPVENTTWRFSFSRYDYTRGVTEPVISSTSPHPRPDFHSQQEWGVITFRDARQSSAR